MDMIRYQIHREYEQLPFQFPVLAWAKVELNTMGSIHMQWLPKVEHSSFLSPCTVCDLTLRGKLVT